MEDFLRFVDALRKRMPVHVEIYYSKVMDWCITVYRKGCKNLYPDACFRGDDVILCNEQDADMGLCFAKAHVKLKHWLLVHEGGY